MAGPEPRRPAEGRSPPRTTLADLYAIMLLYLAISGLFIIKGRLGLRWRGTILIGLGVAVPIMYVVLSGGPDAHGGGDAAEVAGPRP